MMTSKEMTLDYHCVSLHQYIEDKITLLQEDFRIKLTAEEIYNMRQLTSEIAVDQYAHTLIMTKL